MRRKFKRQKSPMLRITLPYLILTIFIIGLVVTGSYLFLSPRLNKYIPVEIAADKSFGWKFPITKFPLTGENSNLIAYSNIRDPGGTPQGLPMRLKIPIIGVDSAIEDAYITSDGRMDVPAGTKNVAWFALGPHPGKEGSAVIGGHYGFYEANKGPTVFYNLDKLKSGDKVYIEDDSGNTLAFVVRRIQLFDRNADATTVFTSNDGLAHLNLITCEGEWNQVNDSYPDRRVVFTDAIPMEEAVVVSKPKIALVATSIPTNIPTISPTAIPTIQSATPSSAKKAAPTPNILIASAKSLYATPLDGVISSFLLLSIVFVGIKTIKRG